MTTLCKRPDGTTCGQEVCRCEAISTKHHKGQGGESASPSDLNCPLPPVCWTCGEAVHTAVTPDGDMIYMHLRPLMQTAEEADGTKPEPGQERCRRQKGGECAQGRELCDGKAYIRDHWPWCAKCDAKWPVRDVPLGQVQPEFIHHADDGSPCLGPECKAHPSTGGQIIERHEHQDQWVDCPGKPTEPGIVERLHSLCTCILSGSLRGKKCSACEAATHIEGLETERRELYEAANANLGEGDEPVTSHEDLRVMLLEAYPNERYLRAENQRLREALEKIASFSDQDEMDSWRGTDTGNTDDAYEQGSENAYGACARIARESLKETP